MKTTLKLKGLFGWVRVSCSIGASLVWVVPMGVLNAQDFTYTNTNGSMTITRYIGPGGNVAIPATIDGLPVTAIGGVAFLGNTNVTAITIPDSVTDIEDGLAFMGGVSGAFTQCSALTNVVLGARVAYIGAATFGYCTNLTRVSIPDSSVTTLSFGAFGYCRSLTNLILPASLTTIDDYAFTGCTSLAGLYFKGSAPPTNVGQAFVFYGTTNVTVYYLPATSGWGPNYLGRPAKLWNPEAQTTDGSLGVRQNQFGFNIAGTPGIPLVIEASADLAAAHWTPLQACTLTNGLLYFSDPQWTNHPRGFYRIRSP